MLVIPIGQEHGEVRRHPWVSYAIIAANVVVFVVLGIASVRSDVPRRFEEKAKEITEYLVRNPHLTVPEELVPFYGRRAIQLLEHARKDSSPPVEWAARRQQQKLNAMARDLFAIARELPLLKPGFVPGQPDAFAVVSSMFVHAGLLHLVGNMLFFFATGPFLEDVFGRLGFALLYVASGVAALVAHSWQNPGSLAPVVGASGAVAGIMGAFLVRLRTSRIAFLCVPIVFIPWIRFRAFVPAFVFLPLWFLAQFLLATNLPDPGGVALWAHVGGFAFGAAAALVLVLLRVEQRWIHPAIESEIGWKQKEGIVQAIDAAAGGDLAVARRRAAEVLREDPSNVDAQRVACDLALEARDWPAYGRAATRLLDFYLARKEHELATHLINEVPPRALDELPAKFHQRAASFLDRQGEKLWASRFYRQLAEHHPGAPGGLRALLRLAEIDLEEGDVAGARRALQRAKEHPECVGEWRQIVERKTAELPH